MNRVLVPAARADAALRRRQRSFGGCLSGRCRGREIHLAAGEAPALACEIDRLHERAGALEVLAVATNRL
jgi:hypothetical protein